MGEGIRLTYLVSLEKSGKTSTSVSRNKKIRENRPLNKVELIIKEIYYEKFYF